MKTLAVACLFKILRSSMLPILALLQALFYKSMIRLSCSYRLFPLSILLLILTEIAYAQGNPIGNDSLREEFIKVGFHRLFLSSSGPKDAKLTVVFESGAGGSSTDWTQVRSLLPTGIRTIAYDRAGLGKSEAGPLPRTMAQEVLELHHLLKKAHIKGPIILVGQSIGGLLVRLYSEQYGKSVVGMVLVDPTHESAMLGSIRYGGWVHLREKAVGKPIPQPQLRDKISAANDATADYMAEEFQQIYLSSKNNPEPLGNRPLVVIGAGKRNQPPGTPEEEWKALRAERDQQIQELTSLSANSKYILDPTSGHLIHYDNPQLVAKAIQMVIKSFETKTKL